jgi:hypothetical protein
MRFVWGTQTILGLPCVRGALTKIEKRTSTAWPGVLSKLLFKKR